MPTIEVPPDLTPERLKNLTIFSKIFDKDSKVSSQIKGELGNFVSLSRDLEEATARGDLKAQKKAQRRLRRLEGPTDVQKFLKQAIPGAAMVLFAGMVPFGLYEFANTWNAAGMNFSQIGKAAGDIGTTFLHFNILNPGSTINRISTDFTTIQTTLLQTLPQRAGELLKDSAEVVGGGLGTLASAIARPWKAPRKRGRFPF
ncbi:MAG TPA: hypothetical protein VF189_03620 [Patescibacteria group bacterium]